MEEATAPRNTGRPHFDREAEQHRHSMEITQMNFRMEAVRLAQQVALENARNRPMGEREITAEEIETLALKLAEIVGA